MMDETTKNLSVQIQLNICKRCKNAHTGHSTLCESCFESFSNYLHEYRCKPPDWFTIKLAQVNSNKPLRWCPRCRKFHNDESTICSMCKQKSTADGLLSWLQKVRRKKKAEERNLGIKLNAELIFRLC